MRFNHVVRGGNNELLSRRLWPGSHSSQRYLSEIYSIYVKEEIKTKFRFDKEAGYNFAIGDIHMVVLSTQEIDNSSF